LVEVELTNLALYFTPLKGVKSVIELGPDAETEDVTPKIE
jgi:hypothetical protein